ncbi:Vascular plant one zinc finger protein [Zea mays]|uniref:Vascular plant one zinc finger protein n=2 Tax=Zea mays TaxID=4577 RepID=A0A1D6GBH9_MAIZE|nr:Vascular plant one zinc finger protein [Zea mays]
MLGPAVAFPKAADPDDDPTKWQPENSAEHLACETKDGAPEEGKGKQPPRPRPFRSTSTRAQRSRRRMRMRMGKGPSSRAGSRHRQFRARAMTRVDDLQEVFSGLQSARKDSRSADAAVLEAQLQQMLREWRSELSDPSPASSLQGNARELSDPPSDTLRLLQLVVAEEEDDATSKMVEQQQQQPPPPLPANRSQGHAHVVCQGMKPEPREEAVDVAVDQPQLLSQGVLPNGAATASAMFHDQLYYVNQELTVEDFLYDDDYKIDLSGSNLDVINNLEGIVQLEYPDHNLPQGLAPNAYLDMNSCGQSAGAVFLHMPDLLTTMTSAPSAFLKPKCALWDCPRPAIGSERWHNYCSMYHADLAVQEEGPPGTMPVIRPRGIDLKDGPLFAALSAKVQGKNVGVPICEGAATAKSPWNAPELFDLYIFEGESIREWLFFDKPRRAFDSGNRKQRSLPDYNGRGWHESRKQVMKDFGGLKRSYYMDPQPSNGYEWHLYEYEINDCDAFALYRLEFKSSDAKKIAKSKLGCNPLNEIQQQMDRLSADSPVDTKRTARSRTEPNPIDVNTNIYSVPNTTVQTDVPNAYQPGSQVDQMTYLNGSVVYGPHLPYGYSTERSDFYWNSNDGT